MTPTLHHLAARCRLDDADARAAYLALCRRLGRVVVWGCCGGGRWDGWSFSFGWSQVIGGLVAAGWATGAYHICGTRPLSGWDNLCPDQGESCITILVALRPHHGPCTDEATEIGWVFLSAHEAVSLLRPSRAGAATLESGGWPEGEPCAAAP